MFGTRYDFDTYMIQFKKTPDTIFFIMTTNTYLTRVDTDDVIQIVLSHTCRYR